MRFDGRVAFITGGAYGIGRAYGRALAAEGAAIAIADLDEERTALTVREFEAEGWQAFGVRCDVADDEGVQAAVAQTCERFGGIDILVNNAGAHLQEYTLPLLTEIPRETWQRAFDVNVTGIVVCAAAVRPSMRERGGGVIVNQLSTAAFNPEGGVYSITKMAARGLVAALARELAPEGIRVCGIAPGLVDSEASMAALSDERQQASIERQAIKRLGRMTDVANALLFLCSDEASFITGESLIVSGGYPLRF